MRSTKHVFSLVFLLIGFISCGDSNSSDENSSKAFEYDYPSDCCSARGWTMNFGAYQMNVKIYYPNIFVPNSTSDNSRYYIHTNELIESITSFRIYSQNGELVFENLNFKPNDPNEGWNGLSSGEFIEGAYKAIIEFANPNGTQVTDEVVICALECHEDLLPHYVVQGMNIEDCRWVNQHDGNGSFEPTIAVNECQ